jgi:hypothetical protein
VLVEFDGREARRERLDLLVQLEIWRKEVNQAAQQLGFAPLPGTSRADRQLLALGALPARLQQ